MNPYHELFDSPEKLNAQEHVAECREGMGVPWNSCNPSCGCGTCSARRARREARVVKFQGGTDT